MNSQALPQPSLGGVVLVLALAALAIAGGWKTFEKAGLPGWGVLVPFYNMYLSLRLAGRPGWWLVLLLIPVLNVVISVVVSLDIARRFGEGIGFGICLLLLPFVFYPVLGFGDARFQPGTSSA